MYRPLSWSQLPPKYVEHLLCNTRESAEICSRFRPSFHLKRDDLIFSYRYDLYTKLPSQTGNDNKMYVTHPSCIVYIHPSQHCTICIAYCHMNRKSCSSLRLILYLGRGRFTTTVLSRRPKSVFSHDTRGLIVLCSDFSTHYKYQNPGLWRFSILYAPMTSSRTQDSCGIALHNATGDALLIFRHQDCRRTCPGMPYHLYATSLSISLTYGRFGT